MTEHVAARRRRGRVLGLFRHHRSGLFALAVLVGAGSGGAAVLFRLGIERWTLLLTGAGDYTLSLGPSFGLLSFAGRRFVLIAPVLSGLLIGPLMARLGRTRTGHGVSGVMSSAQHGDGSMAPLPALASTAAATLTIGGGGSVGPEGPIAELGAAVSTLVSRRLGLPVHFLRLLAGAGTAAGIASAFNAPLAGAFFAMEVVLLDFTLDAFAFVVLACVSSTVLSHHLLGTTLSLSLPRLDLAGDAQLGWVALLGVIGGVAGVAFSRCVSVTADLTARAAGRARLPVWLRPVLGGALVGLMLLVVPETYGESSAVLNRALDGRYTAAALLGLAVAKAVATSVTLGTGFAGGVFAPSLCIGGMLGAAMGMLAAPDSPTAAAVFGVIGMGAAVVLIALLPWLDRSPVKSIRYRGPVFKTALVLFVISFIGLGILGAMVATETRTLVARILSVIYFLFFLAMPIYSKLDPTKPVPERVTMSTGKQKLMFFVYTAITLIGAYLFATNI